MKVSLRFSGAWRGRLLEVTQLAKKPFESFLHRLKGNLGFSNALHEFALKVHGQLPNVHGCWNYTSECPIGVANALHEPRTAPAMYLGFFG